MPGDRGSPWMVTKETDTKASAFKTVKQPGSGRNRNRTRVPALSSRTRWTRTRGSSAFLENPLDPNPRFQRFPREPVGSEPAVPPVFFRVRVLEPGWDCRPPHLNTTTLLPTGSTWHPCTTDQGTAGACLSRTERAELKRAPRFCVLWAFLYLSTLPSYMCFTAVYCTCT